MGAGLLMARLALANYDWAVDFTGNDRSALAVICTHARHRIAYERPKLSKVSLRRIAYTFRPPHRKKKPHTVVQRLELLEACGIPAGAIAFGLAPLPEAATWARTQIAPSPPLLVAHLTSRDMQKAIPAPLARQVSQQALERGWQIAVTCGSAPAERQHIAACTENLPTENIRIFDNLDWHRLVAVISLADKYWGADTAPAHIAAALGKKMLIHFGPSRSDHWHPLHADGAFDDRKCACLKNKSVTCAANTPGDCMQSLSPNAVLAWLNRNYTGPI